MTTFAVIVSHRPDLVHPRAMALRAQLDELGMHVERVEASALYLLNGELSQPTAERLAAELLCDPVSESFVLAEAAHRPLSPPGTWCVEVLPRPGVTDTVAESLIHVAHRAGFPELAQAASGQRYLLEGVLDRSDVEAVARTLLANPVVHDVAVGRILPAPFGAVQQATGRVEVLPIRGLSRDALCALSQTRRLALDGAEMEAIAAHYERLGRDPTDVELETLAQTWSEHCKHKTFRARIAYSGPDGEEVVEGLLDAYIRAATERAGKPWIRSAFVDNAGIVALNEAWDLAFKVETHNHPSALEPFGGANTGVGGVVRDILGVSARPIANTDVLLFGPADLPPEALPQGVLHPRRIAAGVIDGVEDYGNKMGIPTVSGAIVYHPGYTANPLVYVGCLGILPRGSHPTQPEVGDRVVAIGGRTGRDGLRGATFSSMEMSHESSTVAGSAVQIGHPIMEKQVLEVVLEARDAGLYHAITDCGAGGFSSAVGEMAERLGAEIHLERAPLKYPGLEPWEIWLSEAQERMVLAVPDAHWDALLAICARHGVEATTLGRFTGTGELHILNAGETVARFDTEFLHGGLPRLQLEARWTPPEPDAANVPELESLEEALRAVLALPEIAPKSDVVRRYDHEVQGGTILKPYVGEAPMDAPVLHPMDVREGTRGVALGVGINPFLGEIDPYGMAWAAVDEAVRNVVAVGGDPDQLSLLDNFCWGNPALPDRLGGLVRCARGCYDAAVAWGAPYISGKDSLNNEYVDVRGIKRPIPGTILISAMAIVPDVERVVSSDLKAAGDVLYLLGETGPELGGSAWWRCQGRRGDVLPPPPAHTLDLARALHRAIRAGHVRSCHDCSEGGLAVALAEMAQGGGLGARVALDSVATRDGEMLDRASAALSESLGRWVVAVSPLDVEAFERGLSGLPIARIGDVLEETVLELSWGGEIERVDMTRATS